MIKRRHLLSILFLFLGLANLIRAGLALYIAPALESWTLSLSLPLQGALYGFFGLCFIVAAIVYWRRKTHRHALKLAIAYQAVLWLVHIAADRSEYARNLYLRDAFLTLTFLSLVALLTCKRNRRKSQTHES